MEAVSGGALLHELWLNFFEMVRNVRQIWCPKTSENIVLPPLPHSPPTALVHNPSSSASPWPDIFQSRQDRGLHGGGRERHRNTHTHRERPLPLRFENVSLSLGLVEKGRRRVPHSSLLCLFLVIFLLFFLYLFESVSKIKTCHCYAVSWMTIEHSWKEEAMNRIQQKICN